MYEYTYAYVHIGAYIHTYTNSVLSTKIIPPSPQAKNPFSTEESQGLSPTITCINAWLSRKMMCMHLQQNKRIPCFHF